MGDPPAGPRPGLADHAAVAGILGLTLLNVVPYLVWMPLSLVLAPLARARARRALGAPPPLPHDPAPESGAAPAGGRVYVVAGEESGDRLLAAVVRALKERAPGVEVRGLAGPQSRAAGVVLDEDVTARAAFGLFGVARSLGFWWGLVARTLARWRAAPPDLLLTVDFPGLNVRLARLARRRGIRTVHLVAPQLWAHAPWRAWRWRRALDLLLTAYPFEPALLRGAGLPARFVGHPLFEAPLGPARTGGPLPAPGAVVELWPGSRPRELRRHAALLVEAAAEIEARRPDTRFRVVLAREAHRAAFEGAAARARRRPRTLALSGGPPPPDPALLGALATSGTATAELAVAQVPMVVFYRVDPLERVLAWLVLTAPFIALPNLVLGRRAVPERVVVRRAAARRLAADLLAQVATEAEWRRTRETLGGVRRRLEVGGVAARTAATVLQALARAGP